MARLLITSAVRSGLSLMNKAKLSEKDLRIRKIANLGTTPGHNSALLQIKLPSRVKF